MVHLAANASLDTSWEEARELNMTGTYNAFEAARQCGVRKVVFASTNHVTGFHELEGRPAGPDSPIRPDSLYGVSKAFGEALGRYYSDAFNLSVFCLRIGSFLPSPVGQPERVRGTWCSPRDLAQLVRLALLNDTVRFGIFYGVSNNDQRPWDLANAQTLLGYAPQDNAGTYWIE